MTAKGDEEPRNNTAVAPLTVTGKPRVLLIESSATEGGPIADLLRTQDIEFERKSPGEASLQMASIEDFVAIVLAGVPRSDIPENLVTP